jgi:dephospho-CoA kinase
VRILGLTGGIAAGKSVVARRLAELGAVHVDADALAREVVEPGTPALEAIRRRFGDAVISPDGTLDRAALGAIVFSDADARSDLNRITHPAVRRRSQERFAEAAAADPDGIIVYDVPLLVEGARRDEFERIVVVHADRENRLRRLVELRGMTPEDSARRIDAQATDEERLAVADDVIDTNGTLDETLRQVDALWERLRTR